MRIKVDGTEYEVPAQFTLGELRILGRDFGLRDVTALDPKDPQHLVGLIYVAMRRTRPDATIAEVDAILTVELVEDEPVTEERPTVPAVASN